MKGIYLGAFKALQERYDDIVYQDINGERDLDGDMLDIDLNDYDFVICTPPCNYYSRANWRREESEYSQITKHLLPTMITRLFNSYNKPFIIENVRNRPLFSKLGLFDLPGIHIYEVGRHTYWSNVPLSEHVLKYICSFHKPKSDYKNGKKRYLSSQNLPRDKRQGGKEVHDIIDYFLWFIHDYDNFCRYDLSNIFTASFVYDRR